jgi:hypothetical protein
MLCNSDTDSELAMQRYNIGKRAERHAKALMHGVSAEMSAVDPPRYQLRFMTMVRRVLQVNQPSPPVNSPAPPAALCATRPADTDRLGDLTTTTSASITQAAPTTLS